MHAVDQEGLSRCIRNANVFSGFLVFEQFAQQAVVQRVAGFMRFERTESSASVKIVAPKISGAKVADGSMLAVDGQLAGTLFFEPS